MVRSSHAEGTFFPLLNLTGLDLTEVEVKIMPISLESMYLKRRAELVCEVTVTGIAEVEVFWHNESDNRPMQRKGNGKGNGKVKSSTATISYQEWSEGMKWYCEATIKDSYKPPVRKYFEKTNGE